MCRANHLTLISDLAFPRAVPLDIARFDCADSGAAQSVLPKGSAMPRVRFRRTQEAPTGWPDARSSVRYIVAGFRAHGYAIFGERSAPD